MCLFKDEQIGHHSLSSLTHSKAWSVPARDASGVGQGHLWDCKGQVGQCILTHPRSTWVCPMAPGPRLTSVGESGCMTGGPGCELVGAEVVSGQNSWKGVVCIDNVEAQTPPCTDPWMSWIHLAPQTYWREKSHVRQSHGRSSAYSKNISQKMA
jgi:hypothetical protein